MMYNYSIFTAIKKIGWLTIIVEYHKGV
jgi:hypothetical protein